jgi:hypothetical protein
MQHATHEANGMPMIWKTGPDLEQELGIAARTANRHLKKLALEGYWSLEYKPRPGRIGPVTWLTLSDKGAGVLKVAQSSGSAKTGQKKGPLVSNIAGAASGTIGAGQPSQTVTSIQKLQTGVTTKKTSSFLLSGKAKKKALQGLSNPLPGYHAVPLKKFNATLDEEAFAPLVSSSFGAHGLKQWDWSSAYTWAHIREIVAKLKKAGLIGEKEWANFLESIVQHWEIIRLRMAGKYESHSSNLHAPSPMALAHEFDVILAAVDEINAPPKPKGKSFADGFWSGSDINGSTKQKGKSTLDGTL